MEVLLDIPFVAGVTKTLTIVHGLGPNGNIILPGSRSYHIDFSLAVAGYELLAELPRDQFLGALTIATEMSHIRQGKEES